REPRARRRFLDQRADPRVELVLGGTRAISDGAYAGTDRAHHVANDFRVERALAAEVVIQHRLVDAGAGGDAVSAGGVVAALGELVRGGTEDRGTGITHGAARHGLLCRSWREFRARGD